MIYKSRCIIQDLYYTKYKAVRIVLYKFHQHLWRFHSFWRFFHKNLSIFHQNPMFFHANPSIFHQNWSMIDEINDDFVAKKHENLSNAWFYYQIWYFWWKSESNRENPSKIDHFYVKIDLYYTKFVLYIIQPSPGLYFTT